MHPSNFKTRLLFQYKLSVYYNKTPLIMQTETESILCIRQILTRLLFQYKLSVYYNKTPLIMQTETESILCIVKL